ncbi:MAG TPA: hypothetical protein VFG45_12860 [Candidatus Nitrosocosmicus sp.]|nr:hypothetical protein [Candidatus Nitrosocosmicus sp.]
MILLISNSVIPVHLLSSVNGFSEDPSLIQLPIEVSSQSLLNMDSMKDFTTGPESEIVSEKESTIKSDLADEETNDVNNIVTNSEITHVKHIGVENSEEDFNSKSESNEVDTNANDESRGDSTYAKVHHKNKSYEDKDEHHNDNSGHNNQNNQNNQNGPRNIKGPVKLTFVDSYWTNNVAPETVVASISSGQVTAQQMPPVARQEVGPGEGNSVLAVTVINQGFSDISGVKGYFDFPKGFKALVTPDNVDSDTAISSYNGVVKAGQSFVLYFPVNISSNTQIGKEYHGELKIKYFKLTEQSKKDFRTANIEVPFRLTGKVLIEIKGADVGSIAPNLNGYGVRNPNMGLDILNAKAGSANTLNIDINNVGSAVATGVTVEVLNSNTQITNSGVASDSQDNSTISSSRTSTQVPYINLGNTVFDIGTISPQQQFKIDPVIFPPASSGNSLQNIDIRVSYNDAYGNKKTVNHLMGVQVVPTSPQNDFYVSPANSNSEKGNYFQSGNFLQSGIKNLLQTSERSKITTVANIYPYQSFPMSTVYTPFDQGKLMAGLKPISTQSPNSSNKQLEIVAGKVQNISFSLNNFENNNNNNNNNLISDLGITISPQSPSVKIVGNSVWNIPNLNDGPNTITTSVFAAPSLIGNPIFFTVKVQYLKNNQEIKTSTFSLGAIVKGEIKPTINDLQIRPIGNTYNLVGNVLNQGNFIAKFSKINIVEDGTSLTQGNQQSKTYFTNPDSSLGEYLGDLPVNQPIPFSIPLSESDIFKFYNLGKNNITNSNSESAHTIMLPLRITFTDSVQETKEIKASYPLLVDSAILNGGETSSVNNGFVDSYWAVDAPLQSNSASTSSSFTKSTIQKAVAPGDGSSILAVELSNNGFSDINGITGYLKLPGGFEKDNGAVPVTSSGLPLPDNSTAIASNGNLIKSGQTFTLYFKVNVLESARIGAHTGELTIYYFKVPDTQIGTYRTQEIKIPFYLTGVPILDATANITDLEPGINNPVKIIIHNRGTAAATGSILQLSESDQTVVSDSSSSQITGNDSSFEDLQEDSASMPLINTGQSTFNLKTIPPGGSAEFVVNIIPSMNSVESLQKVILRITYVNPVGISNSVDKTIGFRILPNPPEGGLSVSPSNPANNTDGGLSVSASKLGQTPSEKLIENSIFVSGEKENGMFPLHFDTNDRDRITFTTINDLNKTNQPPSSPKTQSSSSLNSQTVFITAGKIDDFKFNISNNNNNEIRNAVVTLSVNSGSLEILGNSKWNIGTIASGSTLSLSTKIFASTSLINNPVSFKVSIEYISNGQLKNNSFNIGANVVGDIDVSVNDVSVDNIGGVLNAVGSLLNKGNTGGLFTTVELITDKIRVDKEIDKLAQKGENITGLRIVSPQSTTPQYLGDLEEDSPLPFNIPLSTSNKSASGNYLVPLKIEYYDDLRNLYTVYSSSIVYVDLPKNNINENQGIGEYLSPSNPIGLIMIIAVIIIALLIIRRVRKKRNAKHLKNNKKIGEGTSFIDLLDNVKKGDDIKKGDDKNLKK